MQLSFLSTTNFPYIKGDPLMYLNFSITPFTNQQKYISHVFQNLILNLKIQMKMVAAMFFIYRPTIKMASRRWFLFIFFVLNYKAVLSSMGSSTAPPHLCSADQSLVLLKLKDSFVIEDSASQDCEFSGQISYPKTLSWKNNTDCCSWDGITCEELTWKVIELDLSCSQLNGVIGSNSSLFQLSDLQRLNLAGNGFSASQISRKFGSFMDMAYLNLSNSGFSGQVPAEISQLSKLVSLDLSTAFDEISLAPRTFKLLLQNLTNLRELLLSSIDISSSIPRNPSSSLMIIDLRDTNLQGELPDNVFHLPNLQKLVLNNNVHLTGRLPDIRWNSSSSLQYLDLSSTGFSGNLPVAIGHLKLLQTLDISYCNFMGPLPKSIGDLTQIKDLNLGSNNFSGHVPQTFINLRQLSQLDLTYNRLEGPIPNIFGRLTKLTELSLSHNSFTGQFPPSITNLTQLESIELTNNSLTGPLPSLLAEQFPNLKLLFLGYNLFTGTLPSWLFSLPSLKFIGLQSNQLEGQLREFQHQLIEYIDLSGNKLHGPIPKSLSKLVNLTTLDLSSNTFSGDLDIGMFSDHKNLRYLRLSFNNLSVIASNKANLPQSVGRLWLASCNIRDLNFLSMAKRIGVLDLSWNNIQGEVPEWAWSTWADSVYYLNLSHNLITHTSKHPLNNIVYLDLRSNSIQGPVPVPPLSTLFYFISNNQLSGNIPQSLCKLISLQILDLANNNLNGSIPQCVANMSKLTVLDLHTNNLQGTIPSSFVRGNQLRTLNLRENKLEGKVPRSLAEGKELEVLDLSNNNLNDTFPGWLGALPKLQVLSLRSNNLHGPIRTSAVETSFSKLQIVDLSQNQLSGILPRMLFRSFKSMSMADKSSRSLNYIGDMYYKDSVIVVTKGMEIKLVRILSVFTTVDLSSNHFEGNIPDNIGSLISLRQLNLSHNSLSGQIPPSLGHLTVLESLDLSSNQLNGSIPEQLTALSFLSVLNFSWNHLAGRIPRGSQFQTFQNDSFIGNDGLCGFPLSKSCADDVVQVLTPPYLPHHEDDSDFIDGFSWRSVLIGYGVGMVLGLVVGCVMFSIEKPKWLARVVEEEGRRLFRNRLTKNRGYLHW